MITPSPASESNEETIGVGVTPMPELRSKIALRQVTPTGGLRMRWFENENARLNSAGQAPPKRPVTAGRGTDELKCSLQASKNWIWNSESDLSSEAGRGDNMRIFYSLGACDGSAVWHLTCLNYISTCVIV